MKFWRPGGVSVVPKPKGFQPTASDSIGLPLVLIQNGKAETVNYRPCAMNITLSWQKKEHKPRILPAPAPVKAGIKGKGRRFRPAPAQENIATYFRPSRWMSSVKQA